MLGIGTLALVAAIGCGEKKGYEAKPAPPPIPKATVEPGQEATLMPLAVGNQWVYTATTNIVTNQGRDRQESELTFRVSAVNQVEGGRRATIEVIRDGQVSEKQTWLVNNRGIFQVAAGRGAIVYNPPLPLFTFPIKEQETTEWSGQGPLPGGGTGRSRMEVRTLGAQEVDTETGRLSAFAVESRSTWSQNNVNGASTSMSWFAPKIGLVRTSVTVSSRGASANQMLVLKSHSLKE
jgi:hypothetical protein